MPNATKYGPFSASGNVTGTGSLLKVKCGFKPTKVEIVNRTQLLEAKWYAGMLAAEAYVTADDTGAGTMDAAYLTANAITPTYNGFNIGTAAQLNTASDNLYWHATR